LPSPTAILGAIVEEAVLNPYLPVTMSLSSESQMPPAKDSKYRTLKSTEIIKTLERLQARIKERFPESGLSLVAGELVGIAQNAVQRNREIRRPNRIILVVSWLIIVGVLGLLVYELVMLGPSLQITGLRDFVEVLEPGLGSVAFLTAFFFFLWTFESRWRRNRALRAIHELRAISHVIDMHQLTKDPERLSISFEGTESSPQVAMTPRQMGRYLDYCAELLSMTSKIAALYVQGFEDPTVLNAVDDIESLTSGLSRKMWQKIIILEHQVEGGAFTAR